MSFRGGQADLVSILTTELENMRKTQQRVAEILRDLNGVQAGVDATVASAIAGATTLTAGYVYRTTAAGALADATSTLLTFETALRNDGDAWSAANPSRVTPPAAGVYEFWGQWSSNSVAHNTVEADVRGNAAGIAGAGVPLVTTRVGRVAGRGSALWAAGPIDMDGDGYVEVFVLVRGSAGTVTPLGTFEETWIAWRKVG